MADQPPLGTDVQTTKVAIGGLKLRIEDIRVQIRFLGDDVMQVQGSFSVVVVQPAQPLALTPPGGSLPQETVGSPTSDLVTKITGGTPPYTVGLASGSLPPGVALTQTTNPDGSVDVNTSGTPTSPGQANFVLQVTDSGS